MAAATVGGRIFKADSLHRASVIGRHLLFLYGHGKFWMAISFCQPVRAHSQLCAESFILSCHFRQSYHRRRIPEPDRDAASVLFCEVSCLEQFHRAGNGGAKRDRIESIFIADEVGLAHRLQIIDATVCAKGPACLILGALSPGLERSVRDVYDTPASDTASKASFVSNQIFFCQRLAGYVIRIRIQGTVTPIAQRQRSRLIDNVDQDLRSICAQAFAGNRMCFQYLPGVFNGIHEAFRPCNVDGLRPLYRHCLKLLASHNRSHAASSCRAVLVVHNARVQAQVLACRPDAGDPEGRSAGLVQLVCRIIYRLSPQFLRIS